VLITAKKETRRHSDHTRWRRCSHDGAVSRVPALFSPALGRALMRYSPWSGTMPWRVKDSEFHAVEAKPARSKRKYDLVEILMIAARLLPGFAGLAWALCIVLPIEFVTFPFRFIGSALRSREETVSCLGAFLLRTRILIRDIWNWVLLSPVDPAGATWASLSRSEASRADPPKLEDMLGCLGYLLFCGCILWALGTIWWFFHRA
jgi:hypothetical protein